jgi:hypothetical protein
MGKNIIMNMPITTITNTVKHAAVVIIMGKNTIMSMNITTIMNTVKRAVAVTTMQMKCL